MSRYPPVDQKVELAEVFIQGGGPMATALVVLSRLRVITFAAACAALKTRALGGGAHAKAFAQREIKGWYAAARMLPLFPLYQEAPATGDTIGFHREQREAEEVTEPTVSVAVAADVR